MSDFVPIPGHPGYAISARGEVRSERGRRPVSLSHDSEGRVALQTGGKRRKFFVGELFALADFFPTARAEETASDALARLALSESSLNAALENLERTRKANALLLGIRADLTRRIEQLERAQPKRGRPKRRDVEPDSDAYPLFEEEW
jgi:hypothetical protein